MTWYIHTMRTMMRTTIVQLAFNNFATFLSIDEKNKDLIFIDGGLIFYNTSMENTNEHKILFLDASMY